MNICKKQLVSLLCIVAVLFCFAAPVSALTIASPSGIIVDAKDGGPLFEKNADSMRAPASTVKLMTLRIIFDEITKGNITYDTVIPISDNVQAISLTKGWTNVPLYKGTTYTVRELLESVLVVSANGSACAFAEYISGSEGAFVNLMNQRAAELNLNARFHDSTGLSSTSKISCRSLAKLSANILATNPEILDFSALTSINFKGKTYYTTNQMLPGGTYEFPGVDGLKTGSTTPAGYCFVGTAKRGDTRVIVVLMKPSSVAQRYNDAAAMLNFGFAQAPLYPLKFKDVASNSWYFDAVKSGTERGIVNGVDEYAFQPESSVTRAMFVTVLGRLWEGVNGTLPMTNSTFTDVEKNSWYDKYTSWAHTNNIVKGYSDEIFAPYANITREEMMTILYRYAVYTNGETVVDSSVLAKFIDSNTLSDWAIDGASWSVANDKIKGIDDSHLAPKETATRAQMIQILVRY